MAQQILAALFVIALLVAMLYLLRSKGLARLNFSLPKSLNGSGQMRVVDRVSLTPQHSLYLVQLENRTIVVGVSPAGCARLATLRKLNTLDHEGMANEAR